MLLSHKNQGLQISKSSPVLSLMKSLSFWFALTGILFAFYAEPTYIALTEPVLWSGY